MVDMLLEVLVVLVKVYLCFIAIKWSTILLFCIFAVFGEKHQQSRSINREYKDEENDNG